MYVDGEKWGQQPPDVPVSEIAAIEVFRGPSQAVGTLYAGSGCGLILIWTWHGPNPFHDSASDSLACPERLERFRSHAC